MATTAFTVDRFGGLNLLDEAVNVGPNDAIELLNVDLDHTGRLRARPGYSLVKNTGSDTADGLAAYETTSGTSQLVVSHTTAGARKYEAYASTGGAAVSSATPGSTVLNAVRWGDPTNEYLYIANGVDTIWRWTGAAFSQPAGMPTATYLAVSPASNRLVTANLSGLTSRVLFSDPGAPETFTYNTAPTPDTGNYVDLAPGDGSPITGATSFQNDVYVFKKRRFFVFYGESTDNDGQPVFNYRSVDGVGALVPPVTGDEGVYFFDGRMIWATAGGQPTRISRKIEPLLQGTSSLTANLDQANLSQVRLSYSLGRLFVSIPNATLDYLYTLVYDPKIDAWTLYLAGTPFRWVTTLKPASTDQRFSYFFGGAAFLNKLDPSLTQDAGQATVWSWISGLTDMGEPGRVKVTLESRLWGVGTVNMTVITDYAASGSSSALTLGTNPTVADAWQQIDREGTLWQTYLVGQSWGGVDRVVHYISFVKPSGVQ